MQKLQKNVRIDITEGSFDTGSGMHRLYLLASLEGDGVVPNTRIVKASVLGEPSIQIYVYPTETPGVYAMDIDLTGMPSGVYQLYVEVELDLPLPDGSTQTFRGVELFPIYVW